ncbi:MAG TPA: TIGR04282 family arsenosugar biosynthesis glycosyltransferase, partial [Stellaceae bacterium]|nr:TIGR04282 family arsenosugar biosynthesis glycosyltransferase [Stellaceae bacterium]
MIFAKAPALGQVKSRLAAGIGALAALRFHRGTTERLLRHVGADRRWRVWLALTPRRAVGSARRATGSTRLDQGRGDLGHRMGRVFRTLPPGPVVIVGSDIPELSPRHVAAAFRALGNHDVVFGPAADGGYWLIGLRRCPRIPASLFARVRWSSPNALADTRASLPPNLTVALLEMLEDVDDA